MSNNNSNNQIKPNALPPRQGQPTGQKMPMAPRPVVPMQSMQTGVQPVPPRPMQQPHVPMQPKPMQPRPIQPKPIGQSTQKPQGQPVQQTLTPKEQKKLKKLKKREKDYFFIMRKGVCFFLFLFCLVIFGVSAGGVVTSFIDTSGMPDIIPEVFALTTEPFALEFSREVTIEEREEFREHFGFDPALMMFSTAGTYTLISLNNIIQLPFIPLDTQDDAMFSQFTKSVLIEFVAEEMGDSLSLAIFNFAPILLFLTMIASLIAMVTSFLALFGKRIFRGFFIVGLILLLSTVGMLAVGIIENTAMEALATIENPEEVLNAIDEFFENLLEEMLQNVDEYGNFVWDDFEIDFYLNVELDFTVDSLLGFSNLVPFFTSGVLARNLTVEQAFEGQRDVVPFGAGIGFFVLAGGAVLITILGLLAKQRVPYSIFDR